MTKDEQKRLEARLLQIHKRVEWIANEEARSYWVRGLAAHGALIPEKLRLLEETDEILTRLGMPAAKNQKPPKDTVSNAARVVRIATGEEVDTISPKKRPAPAKNPGSKKR